jgi:hypothetical protein
MMQVLKSEIMKCQEDGRTIIYLDECMFTTATMVRGAYSHFKHNIEVKESVRNAEAMAVVGGVSEESGFEGFVIKPKSINSQAFIELLEDILSRHGSQTIAIMMDNCRVHHSKLVQAYLKEKEVPCIFNIPYSP